MSTKSRPVIDTHTVLIGLLTLRLLNAVTVKTFFQPDEYYQALEPAWELTWGGSSGAWITWEWIQRLRSAIHPAIFSIVYHVANLILPSLIAPQTRDGFMLFAPKTAQAVIAALGDYYTWQLAGKVYGDSHLALTTLCLTVLNPWQWFCSTRTFSNGLENTLTAAALFYWPLVFTGTSESPRSALSTETRRKPDVVKDLRIALVLAATATVVRPTNLLIWIVLSLYALFQNGQHNTKASPTSKGQEKNDRDAFVSRLSLLVRESVKCGSLVLAVSAGIDRLFYGVWTLPALNFLYFNIVQSLAVFYGNNDWHYYLSQGYPLMLTTALPFAIVGLYRIFRHSPSTQLQSPATVLSLQQLATICIALPAALSVLSHKEVRFIYPILAPLQVVAAAPVFDFFGPIFLTQPQTKTKKEQQSPPPPSSTLPRRLLLLLLLSLNLTIASYTTLIHNSGLLALPDYIRAEFQTHYNSNNKNLTLALLMPCHSLPWRSHLLNPPTTSTPGIQAWALTCEPPLHLTSPEQKSHYLDEADIFYANPALWLRRTMSRSPPWTFSGLADHERYHEPGLYTDPASNNNRFLWSSSQHQHQHHSNPGLSPGLDITHLLPALRTSPNAPPLTETQDLPRRPWPHYLGFFAQLEPQMTALLAGSGYVECWRRFNSHWHDDWRRTGDVVVWCLFPDRVRGKEGKGEGGRGQERGGIEGRGKEGEQRKVVPDRPGKQTVVRMRNNE